ncbi:hypothetical protein [Streptomyces sp. NRRL WC-3618]|nr:hypothetical protein [Streptomyces sp. NRRL WC-3618]
MSRHAILPVHRDLRQATPDVGELAVARADGMDVSTINRELSIARKANGW